jgi:putative transposase
MSNYRRGVQGSEINSEHSPSRVYLSGGTYFLTLVTYCRRPLFNNPNNIALLRTAVAKIKAEKPFKIVAAVVLSDHLHFIWQLPPDDFNYSQRVANEEYF